MALIIKGNMPTCCGACKSVQRYRYSDECEYLRKPIARNGRLKDCPILGEIPDKHGDLIDIQAVEERAKAIQYEKGIPYNEALLVAFDTASVVVEASK